MIYFYKHKSLSDYSKQEIDMLGFNGISKFASEHDLSFDEVYKEIKKIEEQIEYLKITPLDLTQPSVKQVLNKSINEYINFFNKNANYHKQAYVLIGNIASGKSTYASMIEEDTHSIIIDSDRFKTGEMTPHGFFSGLSQFYNPEERERLQKPCSTASALITEQISQTGMNIIIPTAPKSEDKLSQKIQSLIKNNYDIHLIYFDSPYPDLADRSYYRYLVKEYEQKLDPNGNQIHGRFVPVSIIKSYGDPCFEVFAKSYKQGRFKSYRAFYNDKHTNGKNEEIDLPTMIQQLDK